MEIFKRIVYIFASVLILVLLFLGCAWLYGKLATNNSFFTNLSTVSSSLSAIGGLLVFGVTFLYFLETRKMTRSTQRQTELMEEPAVSIKVIPSEETPNILLMVMKNTGGGPAYDITVRFTPNISYGNKTLNDLNVFNKMPLLEKGEEVEFFFDSAINYEQDEKPKQLSANLKYYSVPQSTSGTHTSPIERDFIIDIEERNNLRYLSRRTMHDLVNEVEELKQVLLISNLEKGEEKK